MNETRTLWRHAFRCSQCEQIYEFLVEDEGDAARDAELRELGCEVTDDGVRCHKCVGEK